jgi:hypothetical protein
MSLSIHAEPFAPRLDLAGPIGQGFELADDQSASGNQPVGDPSQDFFLQGFIEIDKREVAAEDEMKGSFRRALANILNQECYGGSVLILETPFVPVGNESQVPPDRREFL